MKPILILILIGNVTIAHGQFNVRKISISDLPVDIPEVKNVSGAIRWTDSLGDNVVIITKKIVNREDEDRIVEKRRPRDRFPDRYRSNFPKQTIPPFAYHYLISNGSAILTWKVVGISRTCGEEGINHVKNWYVVTDLNKNFRAEVWLIYKGACIGEESGGTMKIVMKEGRNEYIMNGPIAVQYPIESNLDNNFRNGPKIFTQYALQLWKELLIK